MNNVLTPNDSRAATVNEAAALVFPEIGKHFNAFWDRQTIEDLPTTQILDLNDDFFALSIGQAGSPQHPIVFVPDENQFRRYSQGIYEPVQESTVLSEIIDNLNICADFFPARVDFSSFLALKNRQRLKSVVERAKDLLAVNDHFFKDHHPFHLAFSNGVLDLDKNTFQQHSPTHPIRSTLPVKYDAAAKCDVFLKAFLGNILDQDDINLLQTYCGQVLQGLNHSQTILILTGDAGWGKSSLMKILGSLLGWERVGIIRPQIFTSERELTHYQNKHLLYHPDMPTEFLNCPESSLFKQLVGGDPIWAEKEQMLTLEGHFPIILACNGKPRINLDEDADAWLRRLLVLSFKKPAHEQHFGKMAELILKTEASGIVNWLLEGRMKLVKTKLHIVQTTAQKERAATLLMASESPQAFVRACLKQKKDAVMGVLDLYAHYQSWCRKNNLRPFASPAFTQGAKAEIEMTLGLKYRHDLVGENGKAKRGWKGLALVEDADAQDIENGSCESEPVIRCQAATVDQPHPTVRA